MYHGLSISLIGLIGFMKNRKSVFGMFLSLELMMMGAMVEYMLINNMEMMSDKMYMAMMIVMLAGMESLIGLALLVNYYKC